MIRMNLGKGRFFSAQGVSVMVKYEISLLIIVVLIILFHREWFINLISKVFNNRLLIVMILKYLVLMMNIFI